MEPMKLYEQWLRDFADDAETVNDLLAIKDDPKEIEDRFYRDLEFGTAGMRGVLGAGTNRLNKYNVRRVSRALAKYILTNEGGAEKGVAIAYDSRRKSTEFAHEAALVLCAAGIKVFLYESLRPVPVLSFTVRHLHCIAGIVITASHNPAQYNGYKVYWTDGAQMPPESVKGITDRLPDTTFAESLPMDEQEAIAKGLLTYIGKDVDDAYIAAVKKLSVNPELAREMGETLKIVYTPLHGSGNIPVRRILKEIGFSQVTVVPEQEGTEPDREKVQEAIRIAVSYLTPSLNLDTAGLYREPQRRADDAALTAQADAENRILDEFPALRFGDQEERPGAEELLSWIEYENGAANIRQDKIAAYVSDLAEKYDTVGKKRSFTDPGSHRTVTVEPGTFGWELDQEATAEELTAAIAADGMKNTAFDASDGGEATAAGTDAAISVDTEQRIGSSTGIGSGEGSFPVLDPVWKQEGKEHGDQDWGRDYVAVDLDNQHVYSL